MIKNITKTIRKNTNLSQQELAKQLNVTNTTLSNYEENYHKQIFDTNKKSTTKNNQINIQRLKELRKERNLLEKDIAQILKIKEQQYIEYETGFKLIPIKYLSELADFYNTSIDYLVDKTNERKPHPRSTKAHKKRYITF